MVETSVVETTRKLGAGKLKLLARIVWLIYNIYIYIFVLPFQIKLKAPVNCHAPSTINGKYICQYNNGAVVVKRRLMH